MMTKTYAVKRAEIQREWRVVDADGATLGRLATRIAVLLRGKHRATFTTHIDTGDPVIVLNASKIKVTGKKLQAKQYVRHSGYRGTASDRAQGGDSAMKSAPYFQGTGRRKTSIARVRLVPGEGTVVVNGKALDDYFGRDGATDRATLPFTVTNTARRFNAMIKVEGGGVTGQIGAIAHGIARALQQMDKELGPALRRAGLLTRDPRAKERKKPGLKRARKAPQFTKR